MATAFDVYHPYDTGAGASVMEDRWRSMSRHWLETGVLRGEDNECEVFGDDTGMQVKVKTGKVWVRGAYAELTAQKTLAIASNGSGQARFDLIVARNDFTANRIELDVIQGTPAGSPTVPALTQSSSIWETWLGIVLVASGEASIEAALVTWRPIWAVPRHGEGGEVGYVERTTSQLTIGTGPTDLTTLSVVYTAQLGRKYRYVLKHPMLVQQGSSGQIKGYFRDAASATLGLWANDTIVSGGRLAVHSEIPFTPVATGHNTVKASLGTSAGTVDSTPSSSTDPGPAWLKVEDAGPA